MSGEEPVPFKVSTWILKFTKENFLPISFASVIIFALAYPYPGAVASSLKGGQFHIVELLNNIMVFFISGLTLKTEELTTVFNNKIPFFYGLLSINLLTTVIAPVMANLPFPTKPFSVGLAIFATVPTTLGVGVALTHSAKGDKLLSILLTVVSNMIGVCTVPALLGLYLKHQGVLKIDPSKLIVKLLITILMPTVVGMICRRVFSSVPSFTKKWANELSMFSVSNLACIVWMTLSSSRNILLKQNGPELFFVFIAVSIMHIFCLYCNHFVTGANVLNFPLVQSISVTIMASQKSSPVALAIITNVTDDKRQEGLFAIPCIIGQLFQIFAGAFIAKYFAESVDRFEAAIAAETAASEVDVDKIVDEEQLGDKTAAKDTQFPQATSADGNGSLEFTDITGEVSDVTAAKDSAEFPRYTESEAYFTGGLSDLGRAADSAISMTGQIIESAISRTTTSLSGGGTISASRATDSMPVKT